MTKRKILYFFLATFLVTSVISLFFLNDSMEKDSDTGIVIGIACFALSVLGAAYIFVVWIERATKSLPVNTLKTNGGGKNGKKNLSLHKL